MTIRKIETWPKPKPCKHPEHNPPGHIYLEPGTYAHKCPGCGKEQKMVVPDYELG